jgi:hypothetical protein
MEWMIDHRFGRGVHLIEDLEDPLALVLRQCLPRRFPDDVPSRDETQVLVIRELEDMVRSAEDRHAHRRVLEDAREPDRVRFLE